jgi:hypothetical protein
MKHIQLWGLIANVVMVNVANAQALGMRLAPTSCANPGNIKNIIIYVIIVDFMKFHNISTAAKKNIHRKSQHIISFTFGWVLPCTTIFIYGHIYNL